MVNSPARPGSPRSTDSGRDTETRGWPSPPAPPGSPHSIYFCGDTATQGWPSSPAPPGSPRSTHWRKRSSLWRLAKSPSSAGIFPLNPFAERDRIWRLVKRPSSAGISPLNVFMEKDSTWRFVKFPNSAGIVPAQRILDETQSRDAAISICRDAAPFREGLVAQPVRVVRPVRPAGRVVERHQRRPVRRDVDGHVDAVRAAVAVGDRNRHRIAGFRLVGERGAGLELAAGRDDAEGGGGPSRPGCRSACRSCPHPSP